MVDISITAALVLPGSNAITEAVTWGATVAQGKSVAIDPATGKAVLADSNHATAALRKARGIALNGGSDGQPGMIQRGGKITLGGATMTPGATYFVSDTAGGICPDADVGSGEDVCQLGIAETATALDMSIKALSVTR